MIGLRGCRLAVVGLAAVIVSAGLTLQQSAASGISEPAAHAKPQRPVKADDDTLSDETGLWVTIDDVTPAAITPDKPIVLNGLVSNESDTALLDNQVYFSISTEPATTKAGLDDYAQTGDAAFGDTVFTIGLFDEIGDIEPGASAPYRLRMPWSEIQARIGSAPAGVYHVGVSVLAEKDGELRDVNADARTDTVMSYLPDEAAGRPMGLVQAVPLTAPVARQNNGIFLNEVLADTISSGGRLRNLMDLLLDAPTHTMDVVLDPALANALTDMAAGYEVQSLRTLADGDPPAPGTGKSAAASWVEDLQTVRLNQNVYLLPWANPDASALASQDLQGVLTTTVGVAAKYAAGNRYSPTIVDSPIDGQSSRPGLSAAAAAGANLHLLAQASLTQLTPSDDNGYPPSVVSVATGRGPIRVVVSRSDIGGRDFPSDLSALNYRQHVMAETTVRALSSTPNPVTVIAAPQNWNPGTTPEDFDLAPITSPPDVLPQSLLETSEAEVPQPYDGPVSIINKRPGLTAGLVTAIRELRESGRVYVDLLTEAAAADDTYQREVATSGSSTWQFQPERGEALVRRTGRDYATKTGSVSVTVPSFVALSSASGRFPITVTNGLEEDIRVKVSLTPVNPALKLEPDVEQPIQLDAGESLDIEVRGTAEGSGLTSVRARLATVSNRVFGDPQVFEVRATKIGLAIWIFMGVLGALLFSSAAVRIFKRSRAGGFKPRGETNL